MNTGEEGVALDGVEGAVPSEQDPGVEPGEQDRGAAPVENNYVEFIFLSKITIAQMAEKKSKVYSLREVTSIVGEEGFCPGQFKNPWGVAFNWNNRKLVVSEQGGHRLQFFDCKTTYIHARTYLEHLSFVGTFGVQKGDFCFPRGVSFQPITDNLLLCDTDNNRLQMMNQAGKVIATIGIAGIKSMRDGHFNCPTGVTCAPNGNFSAVDYAHHNVQLFDPSGRFLIKFGQKGKRYQDLDRPFDVSILDRRFAPSSDASSLLLVSDYWNDRLSVWSVDGSKHIRNIPLTAPRGICVDLNGLVYVSKNSNRVDVIDPRRDFCCVQTIGHDEGPISAPGKFNNPTGMCVNDINTLMVVDKWNDRLQFFD